MIICIIFYQLHNQSAIEHFDHVIRLLQPARVAKTLAISYIYKAGHGMEVEELEKT